MDTQKEVESIKERNRRVELDKAWETSWTRRGVITVFTYIVAVLWLVVIENSHPWLNAFIPAGAYILSTLSLPFIKRWWSKNKLLN